MKYLIKIWPWKTIHQLKQKVEWYQKEVLEQYDTIAKLKLENSALKTEIMAHQKNALQREGHVRKMAQIIAIKGGIIG